MQQSQQMSQPKDKRESKTNAQLIQKKTEQESKAQKDKQENMWYIHIMEYYSAMKSNELLINTKHG